ncbi:hypothetical protein DFH07DRAFT_736863 [Mycena maculata]|uniref:Reverse transcriptase zinc-binding domain-containing protein n=1 Tax=Mycena maculata TaxID=230809 RepID=A0AAD7JLH5_9AGAR|nr:hypothetical protein DFH07DRAFT_736863 [Mycena maculata]
MHRTQCSILMQLRTGHIGLNTYLAHFGAVDSPLCHMCQEPETVNHFLFTCRRFCQPQDNLCPALFTDGCQPLNKKSVLGKTKNCMALLAYVAATGCFPRYAPPPS